ncbi:MAG TPA: SGNH/GDSL hydrolase family protein [Chthoniobacteraceae bacterium]|nr:SGNH/GDSL hydrolase family protein [Chthoniobacteraceae bacterium]
MKDSAFSKIEEMDRHFKSLPPSEGLVWKDAFEPCFNLGGHGWSKEAVAHRSFRRLPERALPQCPEAVRQISLAPAGVYLAFATDASEIAVRICNRDTVVMAHMPLTGSAGAELYTRDAARRWVPLATAVPSVENRRFERRLIREVRRGVQEYRLYLPLYKCVEEVSLGFSPGAVVLPGLEATEKKPIVFYGTSITQGGCANTAGSDFVSLVGRLMEANTLNLGFSGNGKGEAVIARLVSELDAQIYVLNYDANCTPEGFEQTLPEFVRILRADHPQTPIVLLGTVGLNGAWWDAPLRALLTKRRDAMMRYYLKAKEAGDANLHFIDGEGLLPSGLSGAFVDGSHPTSGGFFTMAQRLVPHLELIRAWEP